MTRPQQWEDTSDCVFPNPMHWSLPASCSSCNITHKVGRTTTYSVPDVRAEAPPTWFPLVSNHAHSLLFHKPQNPYWATAVLDADDLMTKYSCYLHEVTSIIQSCWLYQLLFLPISSSVHHFICQWFSLSYLSLDHCHRPLPSSLPLGSPHPSYVWAAAWMIFLTHKTRSGPLLPETPHKISMAHLQDKI